jgi:hypothetical protein
VQLLTAPINRSSQIGGDPIGAAVGYKRQRLFKDLVRLS